MKYSTALLLTAAVFVIGPLHAQSPRDEEIASLRAELERLQARLEALEAEGSASGEEARVSVEVGDSRSDAGEAAPIRLSGDLRYRHESINDDAASERSRHRIRARFDVAADVTEDVSLGLRLATGGDNPVSANQSLDGGFSRKSIGVDRAYVDWGLSERTTLLGGKMGIPLFRPGGHALIFDGDLNPEGLALRYASSSFFVNGAGLWVEERSGGDDAILLGVQGGLTRELDSGISLTAGATYYDYRDTQGYAPFYNGDAKGNTLDGFGNYLNDYDLLELFAEASFMLAEQPVSVFADFVRNTAATTPLDTGYALGMRYRDASAPGTWDLAYAYEDLEADAVIATFTDSDFAGGGTDGKGHLFEFNYVVREHWNLGFTYLLNERGAAAGNERDYNRLQADISFSY